MVYKIGFLSDSHIGYNTRSRSHSSGLNMRVRDGFLGLRESIDQMLAAGVDLVLHGGDLFHRSHPTIAEIVFVRRQLERLSSAGIPVYGVTGNHDFANDRGKSPATAAVDDPEHGIFMVTEPYQVFHPVPGLNVHMISHVGLLAAERIMPEPTDGEVNIFVSHGAAQVPGHEIFATVDSPGEAVLGYDVLTLPWSVSLLGHYHGMGALPGFNAGDSGQVWYSGSLLRRGFSDPEGGRGWLLVTVGDDGKISVVPQYIKQRPQYDLPFIDASGLTGAQVEEAIRENLSAVDLGADGGALVRQRVINIPLPIRRGVDTQALGELAKDALVWQPEFVRPAQVDFAETSKADEAVGSLSTAGSSDLPGMFTGWFNDYAAKSDISPQLRPVVIEGGTKLLKLVSVDSETGVSEVVSEGVPEGGE